MVDQGLTEQETASIGHALPEKEVDPRAFKIEEISYKGRTIKLVSIESIPEFKNDPKIVPKDWQDQVASAMNDISVMFMAYFPPELESGVYRNPLYGWLAKMVGEGRFHDIYQPLADLAAAKHIPVAVADIANGGAYMLHETTLLSMIAAGGGKSAGAVTKTKSERFIPSATDARRMYTAKGIMQQAEAHPEGSSIMYVAAPAHVNRVREYINGGNFSGLDAMRYRIYQRSLKDLDRNTRIYSPTGNGWKLDSKIPIK